MAETEFVYVCGYLPDPGQACNGAGLLGVDQITGAAYVEAATGPAGCPYSNGDAAWYLASSVPAGQCIYQFDPSGNFSLLQPSAFTPGASSSGSSTAAGGAGIFDGFTQDAAAQLAGAIVMVWGFAFVLRLIRKQIEGS